ncbi:arylesterase [Sulfurospirillum oryzae]|uniref:arylesterase n=1 Tax=Sulfurospirillum oryzae TaxID=2976535 RepID=UPI0021E6F0BF|nr:arylesterase [Sulfurospirillum oryzae]
MELFNLRNIILIIVLIVGINYYKSRQEVDVQSLSLPLDTKILAFGDSLTFGYGAPRDKSYPSVLVELLHVSVINEGISGELSAQGLERLPSALERHKPDILILCHGANDILRKQDLVQTKINLDKMVKMAKEKGIYVLIVGVPTFDILNFNVPSFYYEVAKENNIEIEDSSLKKIFDNETTLKSDKVHPNEQGYELMAKSIARILSENYHPSAKSF